MLGDIGINQATIGNKLIILQPVGYFDMVELLKKCSIVLTDSGGLQKEAYYFGKPCVTLREETEWVELVRIGANRIAGSDKTNILNCYRESLNSRFELGTPLYGDGHACINILDCLM